MYPQFGTGYVCRLFGKSRQGWHEQCEHSQEKSLAGIITVKLVKEIREKMPRIGTRKLLYMLQPTLKAHMIKIGRDNLYELLGEHGLLLRYSRRRAYTTNSNHRFKKYPNLIRELIITQAGELWVSDITYIALAEGFCYMSIVTDVYSHKIVGHCLHPTLESEGALTALSMALLEKKRKGKLIHHSDRGVQYCCTDYVLELEGNHIRISMTENGDPYENAIAERVNGILKSEHRMDQTFVSFEQAHQAANDAVNTYNNLRPHSSCDYMTPVVAHEQTGILNKRWKPKRWKKKVKTMQPETSEV